MISINNPCDGQHTCKQTTHKLISERYMTASHTCGGVQRVHLGALHEHLPNFPLVPPEVGRASCTRVMRPSFGAQVRQQTQAQFDRLFLQSNPASNNALQEGVDIVTQTVEFEKLFRSIYDVGSGYSSAPAASDPPEVGTSQGFCLRRFV